MMVPSRIDQLLDGMNNPSLPWIDLSLTRMEGLLTLLGNPQTKLPPTIHVAGTNGKGSTIAYLRAIYQAAGYKVHAYTSPHLVHYNERIVLAGAPISDAVLEDCLVRTAEAGKQQAVTYFEATTAAAFLAFSEHPADVLLLEVGLGGRLDATNHAGNIIASVITPLGLDHTEFLGPTLAAVAGEKAGIMRAGVPCITADQLPEAAEVLNTRAIELNVPLIPIKPMPLPEPSLSGAHQRQNAALAATVVERLQDRLPVKAEAVAHGITDAEWPARLQPLKRGPLVDAWQGDVVLDGGHNAHAAAAIAEWAKGREVVMICGLLKRKSAPEFFAALAGAVKAVACVAIPGANDAYTPEELAAVAREAGIARAMASHSLLEAAHALAVVENTTLLIGGSLVLAGEVLKTHG